MCKYVRNYACGCPTPNNMDIVSRCILGPMVCDVAEYDPHALITPVADTLCEICDTLRCLVPNLTLKPSYEHTEGVLPVRSREDLETVRRKAVQWQEDFGAWGARDTWWFEKIYRQLEDMVGKEEAARRQEERRLKMKDLMAWRFW